MRILLIKPKHIGDTLILTPTITAIKQVHPEAEIWVMIRRGCEGILAGCPDIAQILTLAGVDKSERSRGDFWRQVKVLLRLWSVKFDYVFELGDGHRARLFAMLSQTKRRYSVKTTSPLKPIGQRRFTAVSTFDWTTRHRVEKDYYSVSEFLPLPSHIPPLRFEQRFAQTWEKGRTLTDFCVMHVGSRQGFNRWHREGWREVGRAMLDRFANVVISCGPTANEMAEAAWLRQELGPRVIDTEGKTTWPEMAWLLGRAKLYVGLDTAAMHLAVACRCPVVTLFGPTIEDHWHPWQATYRIVTTPGYLLAENPVERYVRIKKRKTNEIEARDVVAACEELLSKAHVSSPNGAEQPPNHIPD